MKQKTSKYKQLSVLLILLSINGCIGGGSDSSDLNKTTYSGIYHSDDRPNPDHIDDSKVKDKHRQELYDKLKDHGTASINQRQEVDKILNKLPLHLLDAHASLEGRIEFIGGDWRSVLKKYGIDPQSKFTDYSSSNLEDRNLGDHALAFPIRVNGEIKLLVRANGDINYANNGENRNRLYYAAVKGLLELHTPEVDLNFIELLKNAKDTAANRYLGHPSIQRLLEQGGLSDEEILSKYPDDIQNSLAYLFASYYDEKDSLQSLAPEMAEYLDKIDNLINDPDELDDLDHGAARGSRDLGWFSDPVCSRSGVCSNLKSFRSTKSNVFGYEWEARNTRITGTNKLGNFGMDTVLARSVGNVEGVNIPFIKLVVEHSGKNGDFIEIVTGPTPLDTLTQKEYFTALRLMFKILNPATDKDMKLDELIDEYNRKLAGDSKYRLRLPLLDDNIHLGDNEDKNNELLVKNIKISLKSEGKSHLFQQVNVMLDLVKVFQDPTFAEKYLFKTENSKDKPLYDNFKDYNLARKITNEAIVKKIPDLSDHAKVFLMHTLYNMFVAIRNGKDLTEEKKIELRVFFRHAPEDMIYAVLQRDDIEKLNRLGKDLATTNNDVLNMIKANSQTQSISIYDIGKTTNPLDTIKGKENLLVGDIYKSDGDYWQIVPKGLGSDIKKIEPKLNVTPPNYKVEKDENGNPIHKVANIKDTEVYKYFTEKSARLKIDMLIDKNFLSFFKVNISERFSNSALINPIRLLHKSKIDQYGQTKWYQVPLDSEKRFYRMPRSWGHEQLFTVAGVPDRIFSVVELRLSNGINRYNLTDNLSVTNFYDKDVNNLYQEMSTINGWK